MGDISRIIDQTINENRQGELFFYLLILFFISGGTFATAWGAANDNPGTTAAGASTGSVFLAALGHVLTVRKRNQQIRLLEIHTVENPDDQARVDILSDIRGLFAERPSSLSWSQIGIVAAVAVIASILVLLLAKALSLV